MRTFYIEIVTEKPLKNRLTLEEERQVPTHYLSFMEYETKIIRVDYKPGGKNFNENLFKKLALESIKKHYKKVVKIEVMDEVVNIG